MKSRMIERKEENTIEKAGRVAVGGGLVVVGSKAHKTGEIDYRYRASSETIDYLSKSQADRLAWLQSHPACIAII